MVFHSITGTRNNSNRIQTETPMASSSTLKTQPLHNFQLHDLKWAMNHSNNQRLRKHSDSATTSHKSAQNADTDSESDNNRKVNPVAEPPPPSSKNGASSDSSPDQRTEKSEKKKKVVNGGSEEPKAAPSEGRSKICIRFKAKTQKSVNEVADAGDQSLNSEYFEEFIPKTWNLRPRKPISKPKNQNGGGPKIGSSAADENKNHRPESSRSRSVTEPKAAEKKDKKEKKQRFSVSLTREEIDEDIFSMTGSKASRRPKKRAKNVQRQLDYVFPGLWLSSITPETYKVSDPPLKG
ncbi:hypothetical protein PTKIN_Ptkin15bG0017600 [Pterospermum kingtungense]